jgi:septal ring factor EnvC (AmiA/AmiB activator)
MDNLYTVLITAITVLGSTQAWNYYSKKLERKREEEQEYKWDCRSRIEKLEYLLQESSREKDDLRKTILQLTEQIASLRTKVELLEKQNV